MKYVWTADNHLRPRMSSKQPGMLFDAFYNFQHVVDLTIARADALILGGDIFNSSDPDAASVVFFSKQMERLKAAGKQVYGIRGNHDDASGMHTTFDASWDEVHPHVEHVDRRRFAIDGVVFYGLDCVPSQHLSEALATVPADTDVLLMHQAWKEIQRVGETHGSLSQIPAQVSVLLTGDCHIHGIIRTKNAGDKLLAAISPGSTALQNVGEDPAKAVFLLEIARRPGAALEWTAETIGIPTRPFVSYAGANALRTPENLECVLRLLSAPVSPWPAPPGLHPSLHKPLIRIQYLESIPEAYYRILAAAEDRFHLLLEPLSARTDVVVTVSGEAPGVTDVLSAARELAKDDPVAVADLERLWLAGDPAAEFERMFQEATSAAAQSQT